MFGQLLNTQRLGTGESATIAHGTRSPLPLLAMTRARQKKRVASVRASSFWARHLVVRTIVEGLLTIEEADAIKHDWARNHRFRPKIASFRDLL